MIDDGAFRGCTALTTITLSDGVESIGGSAFQGCTELASIVIPDSVRHLLSAFRNCNYIQIYCKATEKPFGWKDDWDSGKQAYWYSEESNIDGSHWHYVEDTPTVWR
jgi:hypothetical protein